MTAEAELWRSSDTDLLAELGHVETQTRQLEAHRYALIGELSYRGVAAATGYASLARLLMDLLRISRAEANRRITLAEALTPVRPVTGPDLPPRLPRTAQALAEGVLGAEHVEIIRQTLTGLPPEVTDTQRDTVEAALVDAAAKVGPSGLAGLARTLRARLDQDGRPPSDAELRQPGNALRYRTKANGRLTFTGELDPEGAGWFTTVIGALAAPKPATADGPDPRGLPERQGDALIEVLRLAASSDGLPADGGERPTLLITLPLDALRDHRTATGDATAHCTATWKADGSLTASAVPGDPPDTGQPCWDKPDAQPDHGRPADPTATAATAAGTTGPADQWPTDGSTTNPATQPPPNGAALPERPPPGAPAAGRAEPNLPNPLALLDGVGLIDARIARRIACDCAIIPMVLGAHSEPLDIGRKTRLIPTALRRILIVRDRGCTFPGCTAPPKHCDAHHIRAWANGGATTLNNLTLLCGQHHRLLHHSEWIVRIADDGHPEFIPPIYIDPTRHPRRNPAHPRLE